MRLRIVAASAVLGALSACNPMVSEVVDTAPTESTEPLPQVLRLVGEEVPGARALAGMERDGISARGIFDGRREGLRAFCKDAADAIAMESSLTDTEFARCLDQSKKSGVAWSALTPVGPSDAPLLYIRFRYADAFFRQSSDYN